MEYRLSLSIAVFLCHSSFKIGKTSSIQELPYTYEATGDTPPVAVSWHLSLLLFSQFFWTSVQSQSCCFPAAAQHMHNTRLMNIPTLYPIRNQSRCS